MNGLSAPRGEYAQAKNDLLWFSSFVKPQYGELPVTDSDSAIAQARRADVSSLVTPMANGSFTTYTFDYEMNEGKWSRQSAASRFYRGGLDAS